ncbi:MAG: HAMP domain-containing sensor histidine kinase [Sulfurovaceae bacterium]|nr:HAMP domain-containing sensor histidine kinase [Sulfurovaceae bacterium]
MDYQKSIYKDFSKESMMTYANKVANKIYKENNATNIYNTIPRDKRFNVFLISNNNIVFRTDKKINDIKFNEGFYKSNDTLIYGEKIYIHSLPTIDHIVITNNQENLIIKRIEHSLYVFLIFAFIFLSLLATTLAFLFLKPIRDYITKLNIFIRDTGHELNTPLSIITMAIERMDKQSLSQHNNKQLDRILIASKTISSLYNDLAFLLQYQNIKNNIETLQIDDIVRERIRYFTELAEVKKITIISHIKPKVLDIDRTKITKIIDNLISNAIKYNKYRGGIQITLEDKFISVKDTGIGIAQENMKDIFKPYTRFDDTNGGFGIGLNLVKIICNEYKFHIKIDSQVNGGTDFRIYFNDKK